MPKCFYLALEQTIMPGGDIDLLVLSQHFDKQKLRAARWRILEQLGEQKIDIIASADGSEPLCS